MFLSSFSSVSLLTAFCIDCKVVSPMIALALACSHSLLLPSLLLLVVSRFATFLFIISINSDIFFNLLSHLE